VSKIALVTDSSAYVPPEVSERHRIEVVPLKLIWGDDTYLDGVDISPSEFYARLPEAEVMPTTSQPSAADFKQVFEMLDAEGYDILGIYISSGLSGTMASAEQAKKMLTNVNVENVDSLCSIVEMGFHLREVAQAIEDGADLAQCKAVAEDVRTRSGLVFAVDTLEFLHRGGRIGGGKRFLGTLLDIKPVLELENGTVEAVEQVRTKRKALGCLLDLVAEKTDGKELAYLGVSHACAEAEAVDLLERAQARFNAEHTMLSELSPVIGTHAGPGTVVLAYMVAE